MKFEGNILKSEERAIMSLRSLYQKYGYTQYKMGKFEEYELYVRNKDFLVSDNIITFTDVNGKLMALKPDVTLSIVKNSQDTPGVVQKLYYDEHVYRVSRGTRAYKEIMQTGLECVGDIGLYDVCEVIFLAARSLERISEKYILDISHMGFVAGLIESMSVSPSCRSELITCIGEKNSHGIRQICENENVDDVFTDKLVTLVNTYGPMTEVIDRLRPVVMNKKMSDALSELEAICDIMTANGCAGNLRFDFSIVNDMSYYNGVVFQGFINGIPTGILSGGRYDNLMRKMGRKSGAIGFAVYLDMLERLESEEKKYDVDVIFLCRETDSIVSVNKAVEKFIAEGNTVLVQKAVPEKMNFRQLVCMAGDEVEVLERND